MSKTRLAITALIVANIIWGAGSPVFKWAFESVHPLTLAFARFLIPTVILGILYNKRLAIHKKDIFTFILCGITGVSINIGTYFLGIHYTKSINSPIIGAAGPVFLILGSMIFLKERPSKHMLVGNLLGLTGVLFIVLEPIFANSHMNGSLFGNMLLVIATLGATAGTLIAKDLTKTYKPVTIAFWSFAVATVSFAPFFTMDLMKYGLLPQLTPQGIFAVLFGGLFSSLAAYTLLFWALEYVPAASVGIFDYLQPLVAILIAAPLVHEYPTPFFLSGAILVLGGIYLSESHTKFHLFRHIFKSR